MFDIGWPEILVIAIVLIVVVGPKDLPPMLRAFGRTTKKLRAMANEFRGQFDEALREADLDDVKKTFDEARKLNPMQNIRDAMNPLKDTAREIRSDLEKSVNTPSSAAKEPPKTEIPEPSMKLADGPPDIKPAEPAPAAAEQAAKPVSTPKPAAKKAAATKTAKTAAPAPAKPAAKTPAAAKPNPASPKTAAAAAKPAARAKASDAAKTASPAKSASRARKPKQGEGQA